MAEAAEIEITPEMVAVGAKVFACKLPEVEETLKNAETAALVRAICRAMLSQIDGRVQVN